MISYLLQAGTNQKYVPGTQIFYNSIQKRLTMHIFVKAYTCTRISYLLQAGTNQKYVPGINWCPVIVSNRQQVSPILSLAVISLLIDQ